MRHIVLSSSVAFVSIRLDTRFLLYSPIVSTASTISLGTYNPFLDIYKTELPSV